MMRGFMRGDMGNLAFAELGSACRDDAVRLVYAAGKLLLEHFCRQLKISPRISILNPSRKNVCAATPAERNAMRVVKLVALVAACCGMVCGGASHARAQGLPPFEFNTHEAAIVDSSALMCILMGEPAAQLFVTALQKTTRLYIGAATRAELWLAAFNAKGTAGAEQVEALLAARRL